MALERGHPCLRFASIFAGVLRWFEWTGYAHRLDIVSWRAITQNEERQPLVAFIFAISDSRSIDYLEPAIGVEPMTLRLRIARSTN